MKSRFVTIMLLLMLATATTAEARENRARPGDLVARANKVVRFIIRSLSRLSPPVGVIEEPPPQLSPTTSES